jgi:hypothetical protein
VLPRDADRRLREIRAHYDPDQAVVVLAYRDERASASTSITPGLAQQAAVPVDPKL